MSNQKLYSIYGLIILALGLGGYLITHAKSALISGLAAGSIMIALSFFVEKAKAVKITAMVFNFLFLVAFTWRGFLAIMALLNEHPEKLIPSILLAAMAIVSVVVFIFSLEKV